MMPEDIQAKIAPGVRKCGTVGNTKRQFELVIIFYIFVPFSVGTDVCDSVYLTNQCYYKEFPNVSISYFNYMTLYNTNISKLNIIKYCFAKLKAA